MQLDIKEHFETFFNLPSRETLRELLKTRTGEYDHLDFKREWVKKDELAKHILAFANTGRGCLVFGVDEEEDGTLSTKGLTKIRDKTQVKQSIEKYVPSSVKFDIHDFIYTASEYAALKEKKFQILFVDFDPSIIPVLAISEGASIRKNAIYIRSKTSSTEATHDELQELIAQRIDYEISSAERKQIEVKEHLAELEALYDILESSSKNFSHLKSRFYLLDSIRDLHSSLFVSANDSLWSQTEPKIDFFEFLDNLIHEKKQIIENIITSK